MDFKKALSLKTKMLIRMIAMAGLMQGGCMSQPHTSTSSSRILFQKRPGIRMMGLTNDEKKKFSTLIENYSERSPSAKKILTELANQNACLKLYTRRPNKENLFRAGESTENILSINRLIESKGVSLEDTFFHEAEHVIHLKKAHQNGINACSFSSLNDVYIYVTLLEALAYRKASLCCTEYEQKLSNEEIQKKAQEVFESRFLTKNKHEDVRFSYEKSAIMKTNSETNRLPNQVYFNATPDWNKIVSILSRNEVTSVSVLPQPTLTFLGVCLLRELEKHPDAENLGDLDISCVLANKSDLQKNQKAIKEMVASHLMEVYDLIGKKKKLSDATKQSFLSLIGWPTVQQQNEINQKKTTFKKVWENNLEQIETSVLFDEAVKLLKRSELQNIDVPEVRKFEKILRFEKMIFVPFDSTKAIIKQKTR